jgi:hypothetical protein
MDRAGPLKDSWAPLKHGLLMALIHSAGGEDMEFGGGRGDHGLAHHKPSQNDKLEQVMYLVLTWCKLLYQIDIAFITLEAAMSRRPQQRSVGLTFDAPSIHVDDVIVPHVLEVAVGKLHIPAPEVVHLSRRPITFNKLDAA